MTILALDTTSEFGSIAIHSESRTVAERSLHSPEGFSHILFDALRDLLTETGFALERFDCFAAAAGPGSFTGVRVGLAAVKGLAESMGKPAAGISNLRALSWFAKSSDLLRVPVLDARRSEVYAAVYDSSLRIVVPESVQSVSGFLDRLDALGKYEFVSCSGAVLPVAFTEAPLSFAAAVAHCAALDGDRGGWIDPAALDANYVRRSDAELFWRDA